MRSVLSVLSVLAAVAMTVGITSPASADPAYTGAEEICVVDGGCGTAGGVLLRGGRYYMMTVAHITNPAPLGRDVYAYHPYFHYVGKLAYRSTAKDIAMIDMGTTRPDPSLRVANESSFMTPPGWAVPGVTDISAVPAGPDWAYYNSICTTGWSWDATAIKTTCGYADNSVGGWDCATQKCGIVAYSGNIAAGNTGASGSAVWQPQADGRVRLLGFISDCWATIPCSSALFRPIYLFNSYNWSTTETLAGYPLGAGGQVLTGA
jgi:hypothetical protein